MRKLTTEEYIKKAVIKHGDKYDYSLVDYKNSTKKVKIICDLHGIFEQEANSHLRGIGCPSCSSCKKLNTNTFIGKSKEIHGNKYDYSLVEYKNSHTKVKIICDLHGIFEQKPYTHLNGVGCKKCGILSANVKKSSTLKEFIKKSKEIHGDKYDYSLVDYKNNKKKVKIICDLHGIFEQSPYSHLIGQGCKKCGYNKTRKKSKEQFIKESIRIHNSSYDYSLVEYTHTDKKVKIICKKHGVFLQKPSKHLRNQGCPICKESKLEKLIREKLIENNIKHIQQYGRKEHDVYLDKQTLDFYLPKYNIAIECQGDQHFRPVDFGNNGLEFATKKFRENILRDIKKYKKCKDNNIVMIYFCSVENFNDLEEEYIDQIYCNVEKIIEKIKEKKNG
ncbi:MAG: hypothetical protein M0R46_17800 [Candidatus Muirbacterium halophilum]|nr:hypothetical protein [Candidatus Muirbacterium halophilum]